MSESRADERLAGPRPRPAGRADLAPALPGLIRERVSARPSAIALRTPRTAVTYAELWERSQTAASILASTGVHPGDVVAVQLPSGPEAVTAMLATWLAGASFLPIDVAMPDERRAHLLSHSRSAAIFDWKTGLVALQPNGGQPPERAEIGQGGAAYIIYTSGSTGLPKGVVIGHEALAGHTAAVMDLLGLNSADTVLQFASLSFDVAQEEIWPTLAAGGMLAFSEGPGLLGAEELAAVAANLGVTVLQLPTAYWRAFCADFEGERGPSFAGVRTVVIGGENCTSDDARAHRGTPLAHTTLVNGYGTTESVITASALVLTPDQNIPNTVSLPIGGPVGPRLLYVLDGGRRPVAQGESGELWIGGPLLAASYLHDPRHSSERFVPDPFAAVAGSRMYRTGDMVRQHPDGNLEYLGRLDNQVKLDGHRIELDEVDQHLSAAPGVSNAVAFTLDDGVGGSVLGAAMARTSRGPDPQAVRAWMRKKVPAYLVPVRMVVLEQLPLTTSGKIDRRSAQAAAAVILRRGDHTPEPRNDR